MIEIRTFETRALLMQATAARIAEALNQAISECGEGTAALSGGSTPEAAYEGLARSDLDWPRVTFALVDERFVPPSDSASNEALLRRTLAPALTAGAKLLPMYADGVDLDEAARRANVLYINTRIDIALMGMGTDGHTASWFPQSPQVRDAMDILNPQSVIAVNAPGAAGSAERLTLTRSALTRAGAVLLLVTGDDKRKLLEDNERSDLPVDQLFKQLPRTETWWAP